jgi:hypothetical protein
MTSDRVRSGRPAEIVLHSVNHSSLWRGSYANSVLSAAGLPITFTHRARAAPLHGPTSIMNAE